MTVQTGETVANREKQATYTEDCLMKMEELSKKLGEYFAKRLYAMDIISDIDYYLDHHVEEILLKSSLAKLSREEVIGKILSLEAEAYVSAFSMMQNPENPALHAAKNSEKQASENPALHAAKNSEMQASESPALHAPENRKMHAPENFGAAAYVEQRRKIYESWSENMLWQYYYDFSREYKLGHNLLLEKWQRMLEETDSEEYAKVKDTLPYVDEQKKQIANALVPFCTKEQAQANELRSELQTYSDKMLQLYGGFVIQKQAECKEIQ